MKIETEIHKQLNGWRNQAEHESDTFTKILDYMYVKGLEESLSLSEHGIKMNLENAHTQRRKISKYIEAGFGLWRMITFYINSLEWVLEDDEDE